jgi:DNA polymerase V
MARYVEYSTKVYNVYLKYVSAEDIHSYSIDECFLDLTKYLKLYKKTARELVKTIIQDVFTTTGITATGGIGTNL